MRERALRPSSEVVVENRVLHDADDGADGADGENDGNQQPRASPAGEVVDDWNQEEQGELLAIGHAHDRVE